MGESKIEPAITYAIQYFDETGTMRAPYLICKGFLAAGWNVEIITTASPKNVTIESVWDRVLVRKVKGFTKKIRILKLVARLLKKRNQQVILTTIWDWHCFSLMISKLVFGSPYVIRLDTYLHRTSKSFLGKLKEEIRYGLVMRNADIILAETPTCFNRTKKYTKKPEVLQIPSCFWHKDLKEIEANWEKEGYHLKREPVILYVGRLVERKNVHNLIKAFICLSDKFPDWELEIRGPVTSPAYYSLLQDLARSSGLNDRISFQPGLSGECLYRRYRETSIYAIPSEGEGMPSTIYEAMYFGGAITAGDSGGVDYQLDNGACGLLHEPGDIDNLTAHLETLMISEKVRDRFMSKARQRMIELFTWEKYFPMLDHKFRDLVQKQIIT